MNKIYIQYYKNSYLEFIIGSYENKICLLDHRYRKKRDSIDKRIKNHLKAQYIEETNDILEECKRQLDEYFHMKRKVFDLPLLLVGSEFQKTVWEALLQVPFGKTASYMDLAKSIKNEKAVRAVANANGANAISIIVPCHRIIGTNKALTGYAGGLPAKKKLLDLENNLFSNN